jgi:hypothetical protein
VWRFFKNPNRVQSASMVRKSCRGVTFVALVAAMVSLAACSNLGNRAASRKPPLPPENVEVDIVDRGVLVSWQPSARADRYTVFWGEESGEQHHLTDVAEPPLLLAGLGKGQLLYFTVTAWNPCGESTYSTEVPFVYDDNPANAGVYLDKGNEAAGKDAFIDAHAYYSTVIRLNPQNADAYLYRAVMNQKLKREELARTDFLTAEKIFKEKRLSMRQRER